MAVVPVALPSSIRTTTLRPLSETRAYRRRWSLSRHSASPRRSLLFQVVPGDAKLADDFFVEQHAGIFRPTTALAASSGQAGAPIFARTEDQEGRRAPPSPCSALTPCRAAAPAPWAPHGAGARGVRPRHGLPHFGCQLSRDALRPRGNSPAQRGWQPGTDFLIAAGCEDYLPPSRGAG